MQQRRVFIISDKQFPHGDAGGNRIEYMAKCFLSEGACPIVISLGTNSDNDYNPETDDFVYDGISYKNAVVKKSFLSWYVVSGLNVAAIIKKYNPNNEDAVVIYSTNPVFITLLRRSLKKVRRIFYDVVEWDDENSFRFKQFDPHYWFFRWCFYGIFPTGKGIIAISRNIESYFKIKGRPTLLFPICMDSHLLYRDYSYRSNNEEKLKLIYPGNPENKDDIQKVIIAIYDIVKERGEVLELHFTSVSPERIKRILGDKAILLRDLERTILFHPWLKYEELLQLYYSMDALILFRFNNQVCKSNFPSKVPELLSCGLFIIANECGDFYDYLSEGIDSIKINGFTTDDCKNAIVRALSLTKREKEVMSSNALKCAEYKFNYKLFSKSLYKFVLDG